MRRAVGVLVIVAVGLAFADASVVALALPDLYAELDTTIVGVSWILTTYALAVALTAVPLALWHRRTRALPLLVMGLVVFSVSSAIAGAANSLTVLLVARAAQGVGATLLLTGSLPVLIAIAADEAAARKHWVLAATVGAVLGPALGGVLTQLLDWRAIFLVQAPVVAAALLVGLESRARAASPPERDGHDRSSTMLANVGFALVFAALVAALFLAVLLAIEVWRYDPIQGALLVSALPAGIIAARLAKSAPRTVTAAAGPVLLAGGLVGLALLPGPGAKPVIAAVALAVCGVGFELVASVLEPAAVPERALPIRAAATTIGARHAGLVLGLVVIAPILSSSIDAGIERATLGATRSLLEAELPLSDKIPVAWDIRAAIEDAPPGQVPDLGAVFDERGATADNALGRARNGLLDDVIDAMTRSFRPAFVVAATLAASAAIPSVLVMMRRRGPPVAPTRRVGTVAVYAFGAVAIGLVVTEATTGAADVGEYVAADPCTAGPDTYAGDGLDGVVQRIGLSALNGAACDLGTTRERLVLSLDPDSGYADVTWDEETAEQALRVGAQRAIDDAEDRGSLPGFAASILRFAVDRAPISWLVEALPL